MPAIGDVLGGKYRVRAKLGKGAMGAVFQAENVLTGKQVAIKWMHPHIAARSGASARLLREAQAASQVDHPNIVDIYDIVQDGETLFMVMEMLAGETLRAYFMRPEPAKISELLTLLLPAIDGVAAVHESGVIHRDLKPDNIFLARARSSGQITAKVLDFGVAKLATAHDLALTDTGTIMGTPLYMSPEQLRGDRDVDARADVYAFGAMLYEAIGGGTPFRAESLSELVFKAATTEPRALKELRPDIPTPLARLVDWTLVRDRAQRLPDLRALIRELEPFASDAGLSMDATLPGGTPPRLAVRSAAAEVSSISTDRTLLADVDASSSANSSTQRRARTLLSKGLLAMGAAIAVGLGLTFWLADPARPSSVETQTQAVSTPLTAAPAPMPQVHALPLAAADESHRALDAAVGPAKSATAVGERDGESTPAFPPPSAAARAATAPSDPEAARATSSGKKPAANTKARKPEARVDEAPRVPEAPSTKPAPEPSAPAEPAATPARRTARGMLGF